MDCLKQDKSDWVKHAYNIANTKIIQNITQLKLDLQMQSKQKNSLWANWHLHNNVNKHRKYPKTTEGDLVRVNITKINLVNLMNLIGVQRGIKLLMLEVINIISKYNIKISLI